MTSTSIVEGNNSNDLHWLFTTICLVSAASQLRLCIWLLQENSSGVARINVSAEYARVPSHVSRT